MKVAVLVAPNRIEIEDRPAPRPGPEDVLVRVRAVGICGSDTHYFAGLRDHEKDTVYPFVLGHEFAGEVAEVGSAVRDVAAGTRVACAPDRPCGKCEWCRKGERNVCPNVRFSGSGKVPGCLQEHYVVHRSQLHPLAGSVGFAAATLAEPLGIGMHIIDNLVRPKGGESYAIIGAGPIGLVTTFAAKLRGAGAVYVSDKVPERLEAARRLGADRTCRVPSESLEELVRDATGGRGVDVAVEAAGDTAAVEQVTRLARIHGLAIIEGIPPVGSAPVDVNAARRRELTVIFGRRSLHKTDEALALIESGRFDAGVMLTHEFPLEDAQRAFEYARDFRDGVIKAIIKP